MSAIKIACCVRGKEPERESERKEKGLVNQKLITMHQVEAICCSLPYLQPEIVELLHKSFLRENR